MRLDELYQLGRRLQELAQGAMSDRDAGVSPAEVVVLRDLLAHGPATISKIAARTGFVHSRVSTVVAALRDRGWVVTSVDEADRRRTIAAVTERVRRGVVHSRARGAEPVLSELLHDLPTERRAELIGAIEELHRALGEASGKKRLTGARRPPAANVDPPSAARYRMPTVKPEADPTVPH